MWQRQNHGDVVVYFRKPGVFTVHSLSDGEIVENKIKLAEVEGGSVWATFRCRFGLRAEHEDYLSALSLMRFSVSSENFPHFPLRSRMLRSSLT